MSKLTVTFVPQLNRQPEIVEADDVCAVSDYTAQFVDRDGKTILILGGVERVQLAEQANQFATIDTNGNVANVPQRTNEATEALD